MLVIGSFKYAKDLVLFRSLMETWNKSNIYVCVIFEQNLKRNTIYNFQTSRKKYRKEKRNSSEKIERKRK